jgi:hypothetical protein
MDTISSHGIKALLDEGLLPMSSLNAKSVEGAEDATDKLIPWLKKYVADPDVEEGFKIVLCRDAKAGEMEIGSFTFALGQSEDEVVGEIIDDAEEDALRYLGKIKYSVKIPGRKAKVIFALRVNSDIDDSSSFEEFDEELPNARGIVGQTMRHSEVFAKEMVKAATGDRNMTQEMIRELRDENIQLKRQWFEGQKLIEELRSLQFQRDMEIEKFRRTEHMKEEGLKLLKLLGPNLVNKFLGGGAAAAAEMGGRSPAELMVQGLLESLDDDQKKKMLEILNPLQVSTLMELHQYGEERKAKEAEMQAQAQAAVGPHFRGGQAPSPPPSPFAAPYTFNQPPGSPPPSPPSR